MKIICEKTKLAEALSGVQRAVAQKSTIAALEGVLLTTQGTNLCLCGYNTEMGITTSIPANITESGSIVLGARLFTEIIRKLPDDTIELDVEPNLFATITAGKSKFELVGIDSVEFPTLPSVENESSFKLNSNIFKSMIRQTIFSVSETDIKPVHTGTLFELKNKSLTLVSVDGYRLALRKEPIKEEMELTFVVPGKTLKEVLRLMPENSEEDIAIYVGMRHVVFEIGEYTVISRLLEGEFIDYTATIPEKKDIQVIVDVQDFADAIDRVSLLISDRLKTPIKCLFSKNNIHASCATSIGKADDDVVCKNLSDKNLEIAFNNKYMSDVLKNVESDEVVITLNTALSPIKITPKDDDACVFVILPVRIKS